MRSKSLLWSLCFMFAASTLLVAASWAGTVTGTVKYEGEVPKFAELKMDADPICLAKHSGPAYPDTLVLGDGNTMANVFVYVKSGLAKKDYPVPQEPVVIDQQGCQYSPHVFGVRVGQPLKILNPDGTLHNVHALSKVNPEFNIAMPQFRKEIIQTFDKEEFMFPLKCDVHPWMAAWGAVMSHPFFTVTGKDGKFTIPGLDAGTYEVEAWHEKLGTQTATLTVTADAQTLTDFTFKR
ncbi:MAG: carboxypeptidase regulatory-like domain-containing protein [Candidatus Omnitrophota bacterium]